MKSFRKGEVLVPAESIENNERERALEKNEEKGKRKREIKENNKKKKVWTSESSRNCVFFSGSDASFPCKLVWVRDYYYYFFCCVEMVGDCRKFNC